MPAIGSGIGINAHSMQIPSDALVGIFSWVRVEMPKAFFSWSYTVETIEYYKNLGVDVLYILGQDWGDEIYGYARDVVDERDPLRLGGPNAADLDHLRFHAGGDEENRGQKCCCWFHTCSASGCSKVEILEVSDGLCVVQVLTAQTDHGTGELQALPVVVG